MSKKVVIIGAGLGGLECGYILAKNGMEVVVLEHDVHIGGCLQSFKRGNILFDTGFHYIGGLRQGESLHGLFKYFNLLDLPWKALDEDCFDEVVIGDRSFPLAVGHDRFVDTLAHYFPREKDNLTKYVGFLKSVGEHITDAFLPREASDFYSTSLFARSAYQFLVDTIGDPLLRKILSGNSLKMELRQDTLPLYVFAQINNSFIQSAWRITGGGQQIANHLADDICRMGGTVRTNAMVTAIKDENAVAKGVVINGEEFMEADYIVCDIHPQEALQLLAQSTSVRNIYRRRIGALENTYGMFTAYLALKPESLPYLNRNLFVHDPQAQMWNAGDIATESVMVSFYDNQPALDLLSPMKWKEVEQWADKPKGRRGEDYVEFKMQKVEDCLRLVERRLPQLRDAIDRVYTSTPLSYNHYVLTSRGSAFGIRKDWHSPMTTVLTPRTPISNVLLTGQNLNLHGVLGVSMTSVFTSAEILGMQTLVDQMDVRHWK